MTYNTKTEIDNLRAEIKRLIDTIEAIQTENSKVIEQLRHEFVTTIDSQREEIIRLRIELERLHKADRHRRFLAKKRLGSE